MKRSAKVKINPNDYDKYDGQYTKEKSRRKRRRPSEEEIKKEDNSRAKNKR